MDIVMCSRALSAINTAPKNCIMLLKRDSQRIFSNIPLDMSYKQQVRDILSAHDAWGLVDQFTPHPDENTNLKIKWLSTSHLMDLDITVGRTLTLETAFLKSKPLSAHDRIRVQHTLGHCPNLHLVDYLGQKDEEETMVDDMITQMMSHPDAVVADNPNFPDSFSVTLDIS